MPLLNLAVSRGRQRAALGVRSLDATISIGSLCAAALGRDALCRLALRPRPPVRSSACLAIRFLIIGPMLRAERSAVDPTTANPVAVPAVAVASRREMVS